MKQSPKNAVEWHSHIADDFSGKYSVKPAFVERMSIWRELIEETFSTDDCIVDLGCGGGQFSMIAAKVCREVLSIDGSNEMLELCRENAAQLGLQNIKFKSIDLNKLESDLIGTFDGVILSSVVEYLDDLNGFMEKVSLILKPGGKVIISMPNRLSIYRLFETFCFRLTGRPAYRNFVKNILSEGQFSKLLERHSIHTLDVHYYAKAPYISAVFRKLGLRKYSDNLFVLTCERL